MSYGYRRNRISLVSSIDYVIMSNQASFHVYCLSAIPLFLQTIVVVRGPRYAGSSRPFVVVAAAAGIFQQLLAIGSLVWRFYLATTGHEWKDLPAGIPIEMFANIREYQ